MAIAGLNASELFFDDKSGNCGRLTVQEPGAVLPWPKQRLQRAHAVAEVGRARNRVPVLERVEELLQWHCAVACITAAVERVLRAAQRCECDEQRCD